MNPNNTTAAKVKRIKWTMTTTATTKSDKSNKPSRQEEQERQQKQPQENQLSLAAWGFDAKETCIRRVHQNPNLPLEVLLQKKRGSRGEYINAPCVRSNLFVIAHRLDPHNNIQEQQ